MRRFVFVAMVVAACCSCGRTVRLSLDDVFFPQDPIPRNDLDAYLSHMDERPLEDYRNGNSDEVYRFVWLRSFHDPITVRIVVSTNESAVITLKQLKRVVEDHRWVGRGLCRTEQYPLTQAQFENFMSFLRGSRFWDLPSGNPRGSGLDGASWILEGMRGDQYHLTDRWSPLPPYLNEPDETETIEPETDVAPENGDFILLDDGNVEYEYPAEAYTKHQDEVGLDMLCLYLIMLGRSTDEVIY